MKSKILIPIFIVLFSCRLFSMEFGGGDESGNGGSRVGGGGGLSEINLIYAWSNFSFYLQEIEAIHAINLTEQELKIIDQILTNISLEKNHVHLHFLTKDQYNFPENVYHQTFKIGEDISFNIDQLFKTNESNEEIPFTLSDSIALLINIFDRGRTNDVVVMTTLAHKIQYFLNNNSSLFIFSKLNRNELQIETLNIPNNSEILVIDSVSVKNISSLIHNSLICQDQTDSTKVKLKNFSNLYFQSIASTDIVNKTQKIILAGNIIYQCDTQIADGDFSLSLNYHLLANSKTKLTQDWWKNPLIKADLDIKQTHLDLKDLVFKSSQK